MRAFFPADCFEAFDAAVKTRINIANVPNAEFEAARAKVIESLGSHIGLLRYHSDGP